MLVLKIIIMKIMMMMMMTITMMMGEEEDGVEVGINAQEVLVVPAEISTPRNLLEEKQIL